VSSRDRHPGLQTKRCGELPRDPMVVATRRSGGRTAQARGRRHESVAVGRSGRADRRWRSGHRGPVTAERGGGVPEPPDIPCERLSWRGSGPTRHEPPTGATFNRRSPAPTARGGSAGPWWCRTCG
jgi:hypothetical protein